MFRPEVDSRDEGMETLRPEANSRGEVMETLRPEGLSYRVVGGA
jgi:hypothetical protein